MKRTNGRLCGGYRYRTLKERDYRRHLKQAADFAQRELARRTGEGEAEAGRKRLAR